MIILVLFSVLVVIVKSGEGKTDLQNVDYNKNDFLEKISRDIQCYSECKKKMGSTFNCYDNNCDCLNTNFSKLALDISTETVKPPEINCKTHTTANLVWKTDPNCFYFLEIIPQNSTIFFTKITHCNYISLRNLTESTNYTTRLWKLNHLTNEASFSENFKFSTNSLHLTPRPVSDFTLKKLVLNNESYNAILRWTPSEDYSCYYDIVWFGNNAMGDYKQIEINPFVVYNTTLTNLEFGDNYSVSIIAKSADGFSESSKIWLHFETPSCLETFQDLHKCPPAMPQNLKVTEMLLDSDSNGPVYYDIDVSWDKPTNFTPDYYTINLINWLQNEQNITHQSLNVSGSENSTFFKQIALGIHYQLALTAFSEGGASETTHIDRHMNVNAIRAQHWNSLQIVLIIMPCLAVTAIITGIGFFLRFRAKKNQNISSSKYFGQIEETGPDSVETLSMSLVNENIDEWELDYRHISFGRVLGEGAFGIVRKAVLKLENGTKRDVAVKMLKPSARYDEIRQMYREIEIMKSVKQFPYVVSLIGSVTRERPQGPLLVVEYCTRGDLQSYLRNLWERLSSARRERLDDSEEYSPNYFSNKTYDFHDENTTDAFMVQPKNLLSIARQVALGMEQLAKMKVVHRDLAARNVLVCEDYTVKVSDFGLSRDVYQDNVYCKSGGGKLPIKWMALESLTHQWYTSKSDVWSFGILLWEIVTLGGSPYAGIHSSDLLELLKSGYRLDCPTNCSEELYLIMQNCWRSSPKDRPNFTDLCNSLEGLLENVSDYLKIEALPYFTPNIHLQNITKQLKINFI